MLKPHIECFAEFGRRSLIRPHPFQFVASVFYTECRFNRILELFLAAVAVTTVYLTVGMVAALAVAIAYSAGRQLRGNCASCAELQGVGLIFLVLGVVLGSSGMAITILVSLMYIAIFTAWFLFAQSLNLRTN